MAELGPLGSKIVGTTPEGRPIIANPDGSHSTERSITVRHPSINGGQWTNIPSIYGGKEVNERDAVRIISQAGGRDPETGRALQGFPSMDGAIAAAQQRSSGIQSPADISQLSDDELREMYVSRQLQAMSDDELIALHGGGAPQAPGPELRPDYPHPAERAGDVRQIDDAVRAMASGATFGYADEIAARAADVTGMGGQVESDDYGELLAAERARDEAIPAGVKIPGEIAGGVLATAAAPQLIPGRLAAGGAQIAAKLPGFLKASLLGAGYGGLYGSGMAEEGERLEGAQQGAKWGAGLGLAGYPVVKGAQWAGGKVWDSARRRWQEPKASAAGMARKRFELDDITQQKAQQRLDDLGEQGMIADTGAANVDNIVRHTASTPGPAQARAQTNLAQRAKGEEGRVELAIEKGLGADEFYAAEDAFLKNLRERAAPLYKKAYEKFQAVTSKPLERLLESKKGKAALKDAIELAENEQAITGTSADIAAAVKSGNISLQMWDDIKRGFDSLLDKPIHRNELTGRLSTKGRSVDQMRRQLLKELDEATGGKDGLYAQARKIYSGDAAVLESLRAGEKAYNYAPGLITRKMKDLSEASKESFRTGYARAMKKAVGSVRGKGSRANRIFDTGEQQKRTRAVFPDAASFREFKKAMLAEHRMHQTASLPKTGSQTAMRLVESADIAQEAAGVAGVVGGTTVGKALGMHTLMAAGIGRRIGKALVGKANEHELEMAKLLFTRNPAANKSALDTIFTKTVWDGLPPEVQRKIGQAMLVGTGQHGAAGGAAAEEYLE